MALLLNNFPELLCFQSFEEALPFCHAVKVKADLDKTARSKEMALTALECECERLQLLHFNRR